MNENPLGKQIPSPKGYDPSLLFPIERPETDLPIYGFDLWRSYELAWLNEKGRPCIGILEMIYPRQSRFIVESKSMKLYLHGLSDMIFDSRENLAATITSDLEGILESPWLSVAIYDEDRMEALIPGRSSFARCIDLLDIPVQNTGLDPTVLCTEDSRTEEVLCSHILRTYCPITHQPDWGSVFVSYAGKKISEESLLLYLCSYRSHEGFAEQCCEQIYTDIMTRCLPDRLMVSCRYTRRGGIDINPVRASYEVSPDRMKPGRLVRQ